MSQVTIRINGRPYELACEDGQEDHLLRLSEYLDQRVQEVVATVGQVGDTRLLIMASLLISDELSDALSEVEAGRANPAPETARRLQDEGASRSEAKAAEVFELLADRLEAIAERIEGS